MQRVAGENIFAGAMGTHQETKKLTRNYPTKTNIQSNSAHQPATSYTPDLDDSPTFSLPILNLGCDRHRQAESNSH